MILEAECGREGGVAMRGLRARQRPLAIQKETGKLCGEEVRGWKGEMRERRKNGEKATRKPDDAKSVSRGGGRILDFNERIEGKAPDPKELKDGFGNEWEWNREARGGMCASGGEYVGLKGSKGGGGDYLAEFDEGTWEDDKRRGELEQAGVLTHEEAAGTRKINARLARVEGLFNAGTFSSFAFPRQLPKASVAHHSSWGGEDKACPTETCGPVDRCDTASAVGGAFAPFQKEQP